MITKVDSLVRNDLNFQEFRSEVLSDYKIAVVSRHMSLLARKEVLEGKAKLGIWGDGKEVAQIAMAKQFRNGDWRSGYYRDQTFMLASGLLTPKSFFSQIYGDTDLALNPVNGGRSLVNNFGSDLIDIHDNWVDQLSRKNSCADILSTAAQMPRLLGLAWASKIYRNNSMFPNTQFSNNGNEVAFGTIGDAGTSEGLFFETLNAAGVLQIPMAVSVWDDGFGFSVPKSVQTIHANISKVLKGFEKSNRDSNGILIFSAKGWDYPGLCQIYEEGIKRCRAEHVPVMFHIDELTQPLGHFSSVSQDLYKSTDRMEWEQQHDCIAQMRKWIVDIRLATTDELDEIEDLALLAVRQAMKEAYNECVALVESERKNLLDLIGLNSGGCSADSLLMIEQEVQKLKVIKFPQRKDVYSFARRIYYDASGCCDDNLSLKNYLHSWLDAFQSKTHDLFHSCLYSESNQSALKIKQVQPVYENPTVSVTGREIIRDYFDCLLSSDQRVMILGEDVGVLGGINQSLEGLQAKFGSKRVIDTGVRESSIIGKGIGLALRGLRPIVEIQYFDYLLSALQIISDDLASLRYRTNNTQQAPLIIRLNGQFDGCDRHSGAKMGRLINSVRGIYVCVPRDMTRAAGFYNTLIASNDTGLIVEPLNGARFREKKPVNIGEYCLPLGVPEVLAEGTDLTLVTYGSCVRIAQDAVVALANVGISVELIDVQTLLPFDVNHVIQQSIKKTHRIVFFDNDVPGGTSAFMMQNVLENQDGFSYLNYKPISITGKDHPHAMSIDGDYFCNNGVDDVYEIIYKLIKGC